MTLKNPYKQGGMFEGASHLIFENAKQLRKNMTAAEMASWLYLRDGLCGYKFRRQHPIGLYITDFYCHKAKLIIELDRSVHNQEDVKKNDATRQDELRKWGYTVIRFPNSEIFEQFKLGVKKISDKILFINNNKTSKSGV
jgi:imidazole glycerol-phosphate synthase subunit HisF